MLSQDADDQAFGHPLRPLAERELLANGYDRSAFLGERTDGLISIRRLRWIGGVHEERPGSLRVLHPNTAVLAV